MQTQCIISFGKLLRQELTSQRITQKALASKIGISETSMSQIINDIYFPSNSTLESICKELKVELTFSFKPSKNNL
jgi:transcriptional regulator with XRE-family HTH domain